MGNEISMLRNFNDIEIAKQKFHHYKSPTFLEGVDIDNVLESNKIYINTKKL